MKTIRQWCAVSLLFCGAIVPLRAQVSEFVTGVRIPQATEGHSLSVSVELTQQERVKSGVLKYRQFGETEFKELELLLSGRTATVTLPDKVVTPPYVEYYVELQTTDGAQATYPSDAPEANPLKISVTPVNPKDLEVRILSPEEGETVAVEDLAIAVSLFYASDNINPQASKVFLDGVEVTKDAILTDDAILYSPRNFDQALDLGSHTLRVELRDRQGRPYHTVQSSFNLSTARAIEEQKASFQAVGNGQVEIRNETIDSVSTKYLRGDFQTSGSWRFLNFGGNLHLTNEDKPERQPQNRYTATLDAAGIFKLQLGDAYPTLPSLVVSGKRVRGVTGSLTLGFFNLDVSYGQTERLIEGTLRDTVSYDSTAIGSRPKESVFYGMGPGGRYIYQNYNPGVFDRNLFAIRPSFGSGENFQWGFTYMKVKDDMASISYGALPKENLVAGTDLTVAFDDQRFKWTTQVALSIVNNDISKGNLSDAAIDSVKGVFDTTKTPDQHAKAVKDADDLKKMAKLAKNFITVNEELFPANPADASLPSISLESEMTLNYFNNFIRALFFRRGKAYQSLGNEFVQTDIQGLNVSDRVRLLQNRVMLSASYEFKSNNLANDPGIKTTKYGTLNTTATVFPGAKLPSFTLGYGLLTRTNGISLDTAGLIKPTRSDSSTIADEGTNRFYIGSNYDFVVMKTRHSATLAFTTAKKTDKTYLKRDQENVNVNAALTTMYRIPLQTTVGIVYSSNKSYLMVRSTGGMYDSLTTVPFAYTTVSLNAQYRLLNDRLTLIGNLAPSFGDFERTLIQAGADYRLSDYHTLTGQFDLINSPKGTDVIASLVWRFNF